MPRLTRAASANIAASMTPDETNEELVGNEISSPSSLNPEVEEGSESQNSPLETMKNDSEPGKSISSDKLNEKDPKAAESKRVSPIPYTQGCQKEPESTSFKTKPNKESSNSYIPPNERRLGLHEHVLNKPHSMLESTNLVDFELRKFVGLTIQTSAHNPSFSGEYLEEVSRLTTQFMDTFSSTLRKLTDIQRHSLPGIVDLQLCMEMLDITPTDLYQEYLRNKALPHSVRQQAARLRVEVEHMLKEYYADKYDLHKDDPSLVFYTNEQYEIAALVPQQTKSRDYIPEYFPELPPDFTYRLTSSFMETMTELKKIKMKLFEESRLNEASLYKLIDDDEKRWLDELNEQLASASDDESDQNEDIMSTSGAHDSDAESPIPEEVRSGKAALERAGDELENNVDLNAEHLPRETTPMALGDKNELVSRESANSVAVVQDAEPKKRVPGEFENKIGTSISSDSSVALLPQILDPIVIPQENHTINEADSTGSLTASKKIDVRDDNYFDIVAYSKKRLLALERPLKEIKRQQDLRNKNYYLHVEKRFSSYATGPPTPMDLAYVDGLLKKSFKNVIRATRRAEKAKVEKHALMVAERERLEKANEKLHGTLEFAFNDASNFLDDSDDNLEDGGHALDFGDVNEMIENKASYNSAASMPPATSVNDNTASPTHVAPAERSKSPAPELSLSTSILPQTNQVSGKMPMKSDSAGVYDLNVDANDADNLDDMLEELGLLQGAEWSEQAAEAESEEDELEDL